jgi:chorismate mutase
MNDISHLRSEIDRLDKTLVEVLAERFKITHQIGLLKNLQTSRQLIRSEKSGN